MTDVETATALMSRNQVLITLAARAVGYNLDEFSGYNVWVYKKDSVPDADGDYPIFLWKPITYSEDAFKLAADLGMVVDFYSNYVWVTKPDLYDFEEHVPAGAYSHDEMAAAMRMAIVKVAANIGSFYEQYKG